MSDQHNKQRSLTTSADDSVRGSIPSGERDTSLGAHVAHAAPHATSLPRIKVPPPPELAPTKQKPAEDRLTLPRGGLVTMRKSGGFKFSSLEVTVFQDGRVKYANSARVSHVKPAAQPRLTDEQLQDLQHTLDKTRFDKLATAANRQGPDTFAYELVARVGRNIHTIEAFEGSIPDSLAPLISQLRRLMPVDE